MNNDLWKKKFGNGFQVNFCNEQSDPTCAWNGFFFQRIDDLLIFSYSSNEDLDYCTGQNGAFSEDPVLGQCANWDEFLQKEADTLDRKMAEIMSSPDAPQWVIFATHQMPFTCTRQAKMQKFIPVIEKYCDLHIGGHQHNVSCTKPLYTGYNGTDPYNFYYDNNQSPKLQAALADESAINKKGDLAKGVRYISQNSTGYKCSGKQTNLNSIEQYSSTAVAGVEGDTNIDYYSDSFLPWWFDNGDWSLNGEKGANSVKNPTYGIIEVNKDKIHVTMYQVTGHMSSEEVNGVQMPTSPDFEVVRNGMNRTKIYECEILASDRDRTGRA